MFVNDVAAKKKGILDDYRYNVGIFQEALYQNTT